MRATVRGSGGGIVTFAAMRTAYAAELAARMADDDVEILPLDAIPLAGQAARLALADGPENGVVIIGTTEAGEWAMWHSPGPREPIPGSPAWQAARDQASAAEADAGPADRST